MEETEIREVPGTHDEKAGKAQPLLVGLHRAWAAWGCCLCSPGLELVPKSQIVPKGTVVFHLSGKSLSDRTVAPTGTLRLMFTDQKLWAVAVVLFRILENPL